MNEMSVSEAADVLNVDQSYVRRLLRSGDLRGRHAGHFWLIPPDAVAEHAARKSGAGRPFAPRRAWALLELLDGGTADDIPAVARSQVRSHIRRLCGSEASTWRNVLRGRESRLPVSGHRAAIARLSSADGVWSTGPDAAARSGANLIVVEAVPEFYVEASHWGQLAEELHLHIALARTDAYIRIPKALWPFKLEGPGRAALAASLLDSGDWRSSQAGAAVLNDLASKSLH